MKKRVIAMLLVLCIVVTMIPTAFAAESTLKYVSLGDSMTNGYGLDGYDGNTGCYDYGEESYANQFAKYLGAEHTQLAMSAMRAEDLHWLLELDYTDAEAIALTDAATFDEATWNAKFSTGDYWTWNELCDDYRFAVAAYTIKNGGAAHPKLKICDDEAAIVAKAYQTAVKEADVISLGMGNGNFGVFMFGRIMEAVGFNGTPDDAMIYQVDRAISECDPEMQKSILELKDTLYEKLNAYVAVDDGDPSKTSMMEALINTVVYTGLSYVLNYAGSIEAILQLNPDADIILVALMNTFEDDTVPSSVMDLSLGNLMDLVFTPLNAYIAALPTLMQASGNSVYADATFYYAEADKVECLVDEYGKDFNQGTASTIRDRFVESVVGYCDCDTECSDLDACLDWEPGMVWGMLSGVELVEGIPLDRISLADVVKYANMTDAEKAAYAAGNTQKAVSIAVYLAFEDAIVKVGKGSSVSLDSILGLGGMNASLFSGVMASFKANIGTNAAAYAETAAGVVAAGIVENMNLSEGAIDANDVLAVYAVEDKDTAARNLIATVGDIPVDYVSADMVAAVVGAVSNIDMLCMLLAVPETLSASVQNEPALAGLLGLFARCVIGNGLGGHPSAAGHTALYEAVKDAYDNEYTAADKTMDNAKAAAIVLRDLIVEYYDNAYAYAYEKADEAGYIDIAIDGIDAAIATLKGIDLSGTDMTDAFKAEMVGEVEEIVETLEAAKALLLEADVLDQTSLNALIAMLDEAGEATENLLNLLDQAADDTVNLVVVPTVQKALDTIENEVIPAAMEKLQDAVDAGTEWLMGKLQGAYDALVDAVMDSMDEIKELSAEAADWAYSWLYNNPDKVIAFLNEYGDDAVAFIEEYAEVIFAVLGYIGYEFGDDVVDYVLENYEEILEDMCQWLEKHGENTWELIKVYLDELGLLPDDEDLENVKDTVSDVLDQLVSAIKTMTKEQLNALVDVLEDAVADLKEAVVNAPEVQALIKEVEDAVDALDALINDVENATAEALQAALEDVQDALEDLVDTALNTADAAVQAAIDKFLEAVEGATTADYTVTDESYYVAIGDTSAAAESYVEKLAEELDIAYTNLAGEYTIEDAYGVVTTNAADIAKADLITIGFNNSGFMNEALYAAIYEQEKELNWEAYLGAESAAEVEKAVAELEAYFLEEGIAGTLPRSGEFNEFAAAVVEGYAYGAAVYAFNMPELVNAIREINPDATVIVVGNHNPMPGTSIVVGDTELPIGDYVDYVVDAADIHGILTAMIGDGAIYVEANDVDMPLADTAISLDDLLLIIADNGIKGLLKYFADNTIPTADGHEYIKDQILDALTVTEEEDILWGDADGNGVVNSIDAAMVLRYDAGKLAAEKLDLVACDVNTDGVVNSIDAAMILRFDAGKLSKFPADKI